MAGEMLMSISQDERERARLRSRRMYETDYLSNIATAEDRGRREGRREGERKGRREGEHDMRVEFAKIMLLHGHTIEQIMEYTDLSRKEIEALFLKS